MSVRALTAAFDSDYGDQAPGRRLVLIALADAAGDDGVTWISQVALALKAKVSEQTVRATLRELEELDMVETRKAPRGRTRVNVYRYVFDDVREVDYARLPFDLEAPFTTATELRVSIVDDRNSAPPTTATELRSRARSSSPLTLNRYGPAMTPLIVPPDRPTKVNGVTVLTDEYELAHAVLVEFNRVADTSYHGKDWISKIVMRIREEPSLTVEAHTVVIERAFAGPWWKGAASPSVIYGNEALFQKMVHDVRTEPPARGMTPEEVEAITPEETAAWIAADRRARGLGG